MKVRSVVALGGLAVILAIACRVFISSRSALPTGAVRESDLHRAASDLRPAPNGGWKLIGRVVDDNGPVAGATVTATAEDDPNGLANQPCTGDRRDVRGVLDESCSYSAERIESLVTAGQGESTPVASAISAADGTFVLDALPSNLLAIHAESAKGVGEDEHVVRWEMQEKTLEVKLHPQRWIEGVVLGETDDPHPSATLTAVDLARCRFARGTIGADGSFRVGPLREDAEIQVVATETGRLAASELVAPRARDEGPASELLTLRLMKPRRIEGRVLRQDAGVANVNVLWDRGPRTIAATTDSAGHFVIDGLRPCSRELVARDGNDSGSAKVYLSREDSVVNVEIVLAPVAGIEGTVLDADGRPLAGASAMLSRSGESSITDDHGHYWLARVAPGTANVIFQARDHTTRRNDVFVTESGIARLDVQLTRAALVTGTVVDEDGSEIPDATVEAHRGEQWARAFPDEHGRFHVDHLDAGTYEFTVSRPGFLTTSARHDVPAFGLRLVLLRGLSVAGRVVEDDGTPIPGVEVAVIATHPHATFDRPESGFQVARSEPDGRFVVTGLTEGPHEVRVLERASGRFATQNVDVSKSGSRDLTIVLIGRLRIAGRVVDVNGAPVANTHVSAFPEGSRSTVNRLGTQSGDDGSFALDHLPSGRYALRVSDSADNVPVTASAGDEHVVLRFRRHPTISGRVLTTEGRPVEDFRVLEVRDDDEHEGGRFAVQPRAGSPFTLAIEATGFLPFSKAYTMPDRHDLDVGDIVLERGRVISGRVIDNVGGAPVDGAVVEFVPRTPRRADAARSGESEQDVAADSASTDTAGRFTLSSTPHEPGFLVVTHEEYRTSRVPADSDSPEIRMDRGATLEVSVLDESGAPRRGAYLVVATDAGELSDKSPAVVDEMGTRTFRGLAPGRFTISIWKAEVDAFPTAVVTLAERETKRVMIRENASRTTLRIAVLTPTGVPGALAEVMAVPGVAPAGITVRSGAIVGGIQLLPDPTTDTYVWRHARAGPASIVGCVRRRGGGGCDATSTIVPATGEQSIELRLSDTPSIDLRPPTKDE